MFDGFRQAFQSTPSINPHHMFGCLWPLQASSYSSIICHFCVVAVLDVEEKKHLTQHGVCKTSQSVSLCSFDA